MTETPNKLEQEIMDMGFTLDHAHDIIDGARRISALLAPGFRACPIECARVIHAHALATAIGEPFNMIDMIMQRAIVKDDDDADSQDS
jgi:hypothetical protein